MKKSTKNGCYQQIVLISPAAEFVTDYFKVPNCKHTKSSTISPLQTDPHALTRILKSKPNSLSVITTYPTPLIAQNSFSIGQPVWQTSIIICIDLSHMVRCILLIFQPLTLRADKMMMDTFNSWKFRFSPKNSSLYISINKYIQHKRDVSLVLKLPNYTLQNAAKWLQHVTADAIMTH